MNLHLLVAYELGMSRQKGQSSTNIILNTAFGLASHERAKLLIIDFIVVLTSTCVTCKGPNYKLRFDLSCSDNNGLADNQTTDFVGR